MRVLRVPESCESCDYLCEIISLSSIKFPWDPEEGPEGDPEGDPEGSGFRSRSRSIFPLRDLLRSIWIYLDLFFALETTLDLFFRGRPL